MGNGKTYNRSLLGLLLSADLIAGFFAFSMGFKVNILNGESGLLTWFIFSEILWISLFTLSNLYDTRATLSRFEEILRIVPTVYFTLIFIITGQVMNVYLLPFDFKQILVYGFILSGFLILGRILIHTIQKLLLKQNIGMRKAVILGVNRRGLDVYEKLQQSYHHGLTIRGFVKAKDDPILSEAHEVPVEILGEEKSINEVIYEEKIDDVIIALDKPSSERIMDTIMSVNGHPVSMKILPDMYEVVTGMARTNQLVGVPLIDVNLNLDTFYSKHLKRIFDILISTISLISIFPFWILIALGIKIDSKGPLFYVQERNGLDYKKFKCFKFRTLKEGKVDDGHVSINDSRVTKLGKFLRKTSIDELPQFFNVLKGEMSVVGPRPHMLSYNKAYANQVDNTQLMARHRIMPGITGLAQVRGFRGEIENNSDIIGRVKLDLFYIQNWSVLLDLKIIVMTLVKLVVGDEKAY